MNTEEACILLELDMSQLNEKTLKKQYHLKALEYHPDKCKDHDAEEKFKEIKEAYDYLKEHQKWHTQTIYESVKETTTQLSSYESLMRYFTGTLEEHLQEEYVHILLEKLLTICEKQSIEIIKKADDRKFNIIYKILTKYRSVFHLSQYFYEEMEKNKIYRFVQGDMKKKRLYEMVQSDMNLCETFTDPEIYIPEEPVIPVQPPPVNHTSEEQTEIKASYKIVDPEWDLEIEMEVPYDITKEYTRSTETMILKPTLDDLWENNLYKHTYEKTYLIPLWHHEIIYELNEETDFIVKLQPKMPSNNIWIDENNDLHQTQEYSLYEIWGFASKEQCMFVFFGSKKFMFYPHELHMKKYQTFTWNHQGISQINEENTFDVSQKGHVTLHIYIN